MTSFVVAAQREWIALAPDGTEHTLLLQVGVPAQHPAGDWSVSVSMGVLDPKVRTIYGIDSWQVIYEAMLFITRRVGHFAADGWQFFWERGSEPAAPSELGFGGAV